MLSKVKDSLSDNWLSTCGLLGTAACTYLVLQTWRKNQEQWNYQNDFNDKLLKFLSEARSRSPLQNMGSYEEGNDETSIGDKIPVKKMSSELIAREQADQVKFIRDNNKKLGSLV